MGEAKRRKQLDPFFGFRHQKPSILLMQKVDWIERFDILTTVLNLPEFELIAIAEFVFQQMALDLGHPLGGFTSNSDMQEFRQAYCKYPKLFFLWLELVKFAQQLDFGFKPNVEHAKVFWALFWKIAIPVLGSLELHIQDLYIRNWLYRLNGMLLYFLLKLKSGFDKMSNLEFDRFLALSQQSVSMGETTIQIGLLFQDNPSNIIYVSPSLVVYKGNDTKKERGELMIAVKHLSGCWNHYPCSDNSPVFLSDYKYAKAQLKIYPIPLKAELIHFQSSKLAKILGLKVEGDFAYLVN